MSEKILIVEDEKNIHNLLKNFLENEGYSIEIAEDGIEAVNKFRYHTYDLVILDIMLPKLNGYEVLEFIRETSDIPVVMITAKNEVESQVKAFDLRTDGYIIKPFSMKLVKKRIEAILWRAGHSARKKDKSKTILKYEDLELDIQSGKVYVSDRIVSLTKKEYELLKVFLENPSFVFSREELLNRVWDYDFIGNPKVVNFHIQNLRKKIGDYIEAVHGRGYRIEKETKC